MRISISLISDLQKNPRSARVASLQLLYRERFGTRLIIRVVGLSARFVDSWSRFVSSSRRDPIWTGRIPSSSPPVGVLYPVHLVCCWNGFHGFLVASIRVRRESNEDQPIQSATFYPLRHRDTINNAGSNWYCILNVTRKTKKQENSTRRLLGWVTNLLSYHIFLIRTKPFPFWFWQTVICFLSGKMQCKW